MGIRVYLYREDGTEVKPGEVLADFRGDKWIFLGIVENGKARVRPFSPDAGRGDSMDRTFYGAVFGLHRGTEVVD